MRAFSAGAVDFVTKPFRSEELLARVGTHLALREARRALEEQNARLREEIEAHHRSRRTIQCLVEEIRSGHDFGEILGESPALLRLLEQIELVAATDSTVLIQGETGTGKELVARAIHERSPRRERPLSRSTARRCPRAPRERALRPREGRLHRRHPAAPRALRAGGRRHPVPRRGGRAAARAQAKLLRVLQEQEFERVGGSQHACAPTCA